MLALLEQREQTRMAAGLARFLSSPHTLEGALNEVIRLVLVWERRLGRKLFRDLLAHRFSPTRPKLDENTETLIIELMVGEIERARAAGEVDVTVDPQSSTLFFMLGLYSLLVSLEVSKAERTATLDAFVAHTLRSLEPRQPDHGAA